jgi:hypothetical protein
MTHTSKFLAAAGGIAATIALASPAAAQYGYPYPNTGGGVIGQIIGNALGYGQYPYGNYGYGQQGYSSTQVAVNQCARATEARINGGYNEYNYDPYLGGGYGPELYAIGGQGRVLGIDRVEQRKWGKLRVTGVATTGRNYSNPWGYGNYAYNRSYGVPDLRFSCRVDVSGRVQDIDITQFAYRR